MLSRAACRTAARQQSHLSRACNYRYAAGIVKLLCALDMPSVAANDAPVLCSCRIWILLHSRHGQQEQGGPASPLCCVAPKLCCSSLPCSSALPPQTYTLKNARLQPLRPREPYMLRSGEYIRFGALECRVDLGTSHAQVHPQADHATAICSSARC